MAPNILWTGSGRILLRITMKCRVAEEWERVDDEERKYWADDSSITLLESKLDTWQASKQIQNWAPFLDCSHCVLCYAVRIWRLVCSEIHYCRKWRTLERGGKHQVSVLEVGSVTVSLEQFSILVLFAAGTIPVRRQLLISHVVLYGLRRQCKSY